MPCMHSDAMYAFKELEFRRQANGSQGELQCGSATPQLRALDHRSFTFPFVCRDPRLALALTVAW
jgi:hypothetical protein